MRTIGLLAALGLASPSLAAELTVEVRTADGEPVANAVVSLYPGGRPAPPAAPDGPYRIAQRDMQFQPFVLIVPVGAEVAFPNFDSVRHHVYSFSPAKRFQLKLYAREQTRTVHFGTAGAVALGCNIHDNMTAFVRVSDTALAARTDASGRVRFADAPAGAVMARVWHPWLRAPANQVELRWSIEGAGRTARNVAVSLRPPPQRRGDY